MFQAGSRQSTTVKPVRAERGQVRRDGVVGAAHEVGITIRRPRNEACAPASAIVGWMFEMRQSPAGAHHARELADGVVDPREVIEETARRSRRRTRRSGTATRRSSPLDERKVGVLRRQPRSSIHGDASTPVTSCPRPATMQRCGGRCRRPHRAPAVAPATREHLVDRRFLERDERIAGHVVLRRPPLVTGRDVSFGAADDLRQPGVGRVGRLAERRDVGRRVARRSRSVPSARSRVLAAPRRSATADTPPSERTMPGRARLRFPNHGCSREGRGVAMRVPLTVNDFLERAELVYGDRVGVVDEPDQPAASWGVADLARDRAARAGAGRRARRARARA